MIVVDRSALVAHSAQKMYAVVSASEPGRSVATLHINFRGLKKEFTTENFNRAGSRIDMRLVSGPFRSLDGSWAFTALSENACKVELSLRYQFASTLIEKIAGPALHDIMDTFVDAF